MPLSKEEIDARVAFARLAGKYQPEIWWFDGNANTAKLIACWCEECRESDLFYATKTEAENASQTVD